MNTSLTSTRSIFYPPGGILIWMIIFMELITFSAFLIILTIRSREDPLLFHNSRLLLNSSFGFINTIILLVSGFFMASASHQLGKGNNKKAMQFLKFTILGGLAFLLIKSIEYWQKIDAGLGFGYNSFFDFYWLLTGFHALHVVAGLIILIFLLLKIRITHSESFLEDFEAGAAFWHMCDLIWLLLFPTLFLMF